MKNASSLIRPVSPLILSLGALLTACGGDHVGTEPSASTRSVPAPFPVVSITAGGTNLKIVYAGVTRNLPVSSFKAKIQDYRCDNLSAPPVAKLLSGVRILTSHVNTLTGTPTSGHVAVGVNFAYCALTSVAATFVIKPSPTGAHTVAVAQRPAVHSGAASYSAPQPSTYSVDTLDHYAFTAVGKLMAYHSIPSGSLAYDVFKVPATAAQPIGPFQGCTNVSVPGAPAC